MFPSTYDINGIVSTHVETVCLLSRKDMPKNVSKSEIGGNSSADRF